MPERLHETIVNVIEEVSAVHFSADARVVVLIMTLFIMDVYRKVSSMYTVLHVLKLRFLKQVFVKLFKLYQNNIKIKFVDKKPKASPAETSSEVYNVLKGQMAWTMTLVM